MVDAGDAASFALGEADGGSAGLAGPRATLEVPSHLNDLGDAGGAERVPLGEQAAAWVHRHAPTQARLSRVQKADGFAFISQPQRFVMLLERGIGAKSSADNGMSTNRCPQCAAPLTDNGQPSCEFCGAMHTPTTRRTPSASIRR